MVTVDWLSWATRYLRHCFLTRTSRTTLELDRAHAPILPVHRAQLHTPSAFDQISPVVPRNPQIFWTRSLIKLSLTSHSQAKVRLNFQIPPHRALQHVDMATDKSAWHIKTPPLIASCHNGLSA